MRKYFKISEKNSFILTLRKNWPQVKIFLLIEEIQYFPDLNTIDEIFPLYWGKIYLRSKTTFLSLQGLKVLQVDFYYEVLGRNHQFFLLFKLFFLLQICMYLFWKFYIFIMILNSLVVWELKCNQGGLSLSPSLKTFKNQFSQTSLTTTN